ncbi:MAG: FtsX-like permease family protein [Bacteroidota bacterium]|nr:FtsX-like permease family protein [Bacteroidota bacterium]
MIRFLFKGILHDKSRSLLPVIVISIGVMLTVIMYCWLNGIKGDSIAMNANFSTGHVKVMTRAYDKDAEQMPNDLAILEVNKLMKKLRTNYRDVEWVKRVRFGGLIDFPDANGVTRAQGPVIGWAIDLLSPQSGERKRFNLEKSLVQGRLPSKPGEALISDLFAVKFHVKPGDTFTFFGTTMDGGMAFKNMIVSGTIRFGVSGIDRGAIVADISDIQDALRMEDAAGEVLGYFDSGRYDNERATAIATDFNAAYKADTDEFAPVMLSLRDQEGMAEFIDYLNAVSAMMVIIFVLAMSIVLWNAGLLGGLRRYTEFGVRLALGENKNHIYQTLIYEGFFIGTIGTIIGTLLGLGASWYLQTVGFNIEGMMKNSSMLMPSVARAQITRTAYYIGFIPGLFSMVLGNALSGIGIYKRKTAQLFKELEA